MWSMIPSLQPLVDVLAPAFTQPSFRCGCKLLLAWVLCLGRHRLCRVDVTHQWNHWSLMPLQLEEARRVMGILPKLESWRGAA